MVKKETNSNMKLWEQVCVTDPALTKKVKYSDGSRTFTAINAQSQIKRATELWGPYGKNWGVKGCVYEFVTALDKEGKEHTGIYLTAIFCCPESEFEIASDMAYRPSGDSFKKLLTDLTTKALSKLGFNSDVFESKYDDNKYIEKVKEDFANGKKELPNKPSEPTTMPSTVPSNLSPEESEEAEQLFTIYDISAMKAGEKDITKFKVELQHRKNIAYQYNKGLVGDKCLTPRVYELIRTVRVYSNGSDEKLEQWYDWKRFRVDILANEAWRERTATEKAITIQEWKETNKNKL